MRVGVSGCGSVGTRLARLLAEEQSVSSVLVSDPRAGAARRASLAAGRKGCVADELFSSRIDVLVLCGPSDTHAEQARKALENCTPVVSTARSSLDVCELLSLDRISKLVGVPVVVGAGWTPGLSCLLAGVAARCMERVSEIRVVRAGSTGVSCARETLSELTGVARVWRGGAWSSRVAGWGRELVWLPDPIGAVDTRSADAGDVYLLAETFPDARRIEVRVAAGLPRALAARLGIGPRRQRGDGVVAFRIDVRGWAGGRPVHRVFGGLDRGCMATASVAARVAAAVCRGEAVPGAYGLSSWAEPRSLLRELSDAGVRCAVYDPAGAE